MWTHAPGSSAKNPLDANESPDGQSGVAQAGQHGTASPEDNGIRRRACALLHSLTINLIKTATALGVYWPTCLSVRWEISGGCAPTSRSDARAVTKKRFHFKLRRL